MRTEKVKSNEKRPENKLGCAFCISFQYKIKRKFTFWGQIPNIFYLFQLPHSMKYIWYSFWGAQKYFLYSFYTDNWWRRVKDNEVYLIDDIECKILGLKFIFMKNISYSVSEPCIQLLFPNS